MTTAAKFFIMLLSNKKVRNTIIGVVVGIALLFIMIVGGVYIYEQYNNSAVEAANIAVREYNYW